MSAQLSWVMKTRELEAEIARLQEQYRAAIKDAQENIAANMRLRAALEKNNHHLAKLVNGTDDENPQTWEDAKNQVLATRKALANEQEGQ
jgi:hypothetical protein